jgi:hypothetical protein
VGTLKGTEDRVGKAGIGYPLDPPSCLYQVLALQIQWYISIVLTLDRMTYPIPHIERKYPRAFLIVIINH